MDTTMPPARAAFAPPPSGRSAPETSPMRQQAAPQSEPQAAPHLRLSSFPEIVALAAEKRDLAIKAALESDVRLVRLEDGRLEVALEPNAPRSLVNDLSRKLEQWTGRRWTVIVSNATAQPTLRAQAQSQQNELENAVQADPRVQDVMAKWPGARIETVRRTPQAQADADLPEPPVEDED
jgi:DNA polymerase-3 subunit gamma/tau